MSSTQKNKKNEIDTKEAIDILAKNTSDVIFTTAITALSMTNPIWAILFLTAKGIYGAWSDFGQARVNEFVTGLEEKKGSFDFKIIETDKFKSLFLSTLERHMKESSEKRRHLLRNYLISVAQGKNPEFDYHTKLLNILDQITGEELRLFMLLPNIICDSDNEFLAYSTEEGRRSFNPLKREICMNTMQIKMRLKNWKIKNKDLSSLIHFLSNYGIINSYDTSVSGIGGGGSNDLVFAGLTEVGKVFYDFIDDVSFEKEITTYIEYKNNPNLTQLLQD